MTRLGSKRYVIVYMLLIKYIIRIIISYNHPARFLALNILFDFDLLSQLVLRL